jgi:hypothetical protein
MFKVVGTIPATHNTFMTITRRDEESGERVVSYVVQGFIVYDDHHIDSLIIHENVPCPALVAQAVMGDVISVKIDVGGR